MSKHQRQEQRTKHTSRIVGHFTYKGISQEARNRRAMLLKHSSQTDNYAASVPVCKCSITNFLYTLHKALSRMMHANWAAFNNCHAQKAGSQQKLAPQSENQPPQEKCICSPVLVSTAAVLSTAKLLAVFVPGLEEEAGPESSASQADGIERQPFLGLCCCLDATCHALCIGYVSSAAGLHR